MGLFLLDLASARHLIGYLLQLLALLASVTLLLAYFVFRRQKPNLDKEQIYYAKACEKLIKLDLIRLNNEGASDFAQRVATKAPMLKQRFDHITRLYINIRYGKTLNKQDLEQLKMSAEAFSKHKFSSDIT